MTAPTGVVPGFVVAIGMPVTVTPSAAAPNAVDQGAAATFSAALALAMGVRIPGASAKGGTVTLSPEQERQADPIALGAEGDSDHASPMLVAVPVHSAAAEGEALRPGLPTVTGSPMPDAALLSGIGRAITETEAPVGNNEPIVAPSGKGATDSSGTTDGEETPILPIEEFIPMPLALPMDATTATTAATPLSGAAITAIIARDPLLSAATLRDGVAVTARELTRLATTDSTSARRELSGLAPELRDRLEFVIDRMRSEYGYDVQIVETVRSQERQDVLFAQGRTRPGPVVTWTRDSKHLDGRAADVTIDGSYDNPVAFQLLGKIAREEGLRTLGPRDPGHIELPGVNPKVTSAARRPPTLMPVATDGAIKDTATVLPATLIPIATNGADMMKPPANVPPNVDAQIRAGAASTPAIALPPRNDGALAGTAGVAQVASVAPVARVATVARVADVSNVSRVAGGEQLPATDSGRMLESAVAGVVARNTRGGESSSGERNFSSGRDDRHAAPSESTMSLTRRADADALVASLRGEVNSTGLLSSSDGGSIDGIAHADASERIARLLKVQDAAAERPLTQLLLRVDAPDGTQDRIRVDMRGTTVGATFDMGDARAAQRLNAHVGELQHALERQGLEAESLSVRSVTRATESGVSHALAVSAEREGTRATASSAFGGNAQQQGGRESRAFTRPDDSRQGSDHRHRSRREQKGEQ